MGFADGEIIYIFHKASDVRSALSPNPDDLGIEEALSQAVSVNVGAGLWVVLVAGIVATLATNQDVEEAHWGRTDPRLVTS